MSSVVWISQRSTAGRGRPQGANCIRCQLSCVCLQHTISLALTRLQADCACHRSLSGSSCPVQVAACEQKVRAVADAVVREEIEHHRTPLNRRRAVTLQALAFRTRKSSVSEMAEARSMDDSLLAKSVKIHAVLHCPNQPRGRKVRSFAARQPCAVSPRSQIPECATRLVDEAKICVISDIAGLS